MADARRVAVVKYVKHAGDGQWFAMTDAEGEFLCQHPQRPLSEWPATTVKHGRIMNSNEPSAQSFSEADLPALCETLASRDLGLRRVVDEVGYPEFWNRPNTFESFVWFILEQQVSLASAKAALDKLRERVGTVTAENVLALTDEELRAAYFSRQKTAYVRGLARQIVSGNLDFADLEGLPDVLIRERLIQMKGVGNWTVDVYLILVLHRIDIFPMGDLAAVNGLKDLKSMPRTATLEEVTAVAQDWAPYRTIGTMLVWHYYLSRKKPLRTM